MFESFSLTSKSSTVGVGYLVLVIPLYAARITTQQILMLCSPLGTITNGFNHGIGSPVTSQMIPSFSNRLCSSLTLLRKVNEIRRSLSAGGATYRSM